MAPANRQHLFNSLYIRGLNSKSAPDANSFKCSTERVPGIEITRSPLASNQAMARPEVDTLMSEAMASAVGPLDISFVVTPLKPRIHLHKGKLSARLEFGGLSVSKDLPTGLNAMRVVPSSFVFCTNPISGDRERILRLNSSHWVYLVCAL